VVLDKEKDDEKRKANGYFVFHGIDSSNAGSSALLIRRGCHGDGFSRNPLALAAALS
jgi:hypothetical protein